MPVIVFANSTKSGSVSQTDKFDGVVEDANGCDALAAEAQESTFVLLDTTTKTWTACNIVRAHTRFLPASTFKVPHALIALETHVVEDVEDNVSWDGRSRAVASWNQDTSLASGMENSTVWFYQRTALGIGHSRMKRWVQKLAYGNRRIGDKAALSSFWLDGELRISAIEQVVFLDRLRRHTLPADRQSQLAVADMMRQAEPGGEWFRKSGAVLPINPETGDIDRDSLIVARLDGLDQVGWFVGWIERPGNNAGAKVFAFNLTLNEAADFARREHLTRMLLRENMQLSSGKGGN